MKGLLSYNIPAKNYHSQLMYVKVSQRSDFLGQCKMWAVKICTGRDIESLRERTVHRNHGHNDDYVR